MINFLRLIKYFCFFVNRTFFNSLSVFKKDKHWRWNVHIYVFITNYFELRKRKYWFFYFKRKTNVTLIISLSWKLINYALTKKDLIQRWTEQLKNIEKDLQWKNIAFKHAVVFGKKNFYDIKNQLFQEDANVVFYFYSFTLSDR